MTDLRCRARHPAAERGAPAFARDHDAPLPISLGAGVELEFVQVYEDGAEVQIEPGNIVVTCSHKDCRALHVFRVRRAA